MHCPGGFILREATGDICTVSEGVAVISGILSSGKQLSLSENTVTVVDSSDELSILLLSETKSRPVCCGMSPKDTLTAASITDDKAVISLQRTITTLSGREIEPMEIVADILSEEEIELSDILLTAAVMLVSDCVGEEGRISLR
jgi:hypothetical protein